MNQWKCLDGPGTEVGIWPGGMDKGRPKPLVLKLLEIKASESPLTIVSLRLQMVCDVPLSVDHNHVSKIGTVPGRKAL